MIVGAGSAGCAVSYRLANSGASVQLQAGDDDSSKVRHGCGIDCACVCVVVCVLISEGHGRHLLVEPGRFASANTGVYDVSRCVRVHVSRCVLLRGSVCVCVHDVHDQSPDVRTCV